MSDEIERKEGVQQRAAAEHKAPAFQEAPGEAEADAVRDAYLQRAGAAPGQVAVALSTADDATQERALQRLQRERGNAYVQRVVAGTQGAPGRLVGLPQAEMVDEVQQRGGSGSALAEPARAQMEEHFGADLSGVQIHADGSAATLSRELNAQAFTVGSDVFFDEGKYDPSSSAGQGLIAHELAHVGQQTGFGGAVQRVPGAEEEETVKRAASEEEEEQTPGG